MTSAVSNDEVITLEGTGDNGDPEPIKFRTNFKAKKPMKYYPYFADPAIVPRVKQYLEDNKHKVYIDIDRMVIELQKKYRDYAKKKRSTFKAVVEKAFQVVLHTYSVTDDGPRDVTESSSGDEMDIDDEDVDLIEDTNSTNNQVLNMYMQQQALKKAVCPKSGTEEAKELIDISSDDNDDEDEVPSKRPKRADPLNCSSETPVISPPLDSLPHKSNGHATPQEVAIAQEHETAGSSTAACSTTLLVTPAPVPVVPVTPAPPERPKRKRTAVDGASSSSVSFVNGDPKKKRREVPVSQPCCSFKDIGGCSAVLQEVCKLLIHMRHPEVFEQIGVSPPRGFLLHGPPGCGKSLLASAIAGELGVPFLKVAAPELVAGVSGESEERIRDLFDQAVSIAPCVLFLDEIDAITPNRNNAQREMERRIVAQLLTTLDELGEKEGGNQVLVVGATNRPDSLDPALRRAGRFDREVCMGIPDREARIHILKVVCGRLALSPDVASDSGIEELASLTPGFVGADLAALTREAAMVAVNRIFAQLQNKEKLDDKTVSKLQDVASEVIKEIVEHPEKQCEVEKEVPAEAEEMSASAVETQEPPVIAMESETIVASEDQQEKSLPCEENVVQNDTEMNTIDSAPCETTNEVSEDNLVDNPLAQSVGTVEEVNPKQDGPETNEVDETEKTDNFAPSDSSTQIDAIPHIVDVEKEGLNSDVLESQSEKNKTDDDVEVLEVEMIDSSEKPSEVSETKPDAEGVKTRDLELSQKLMPSSLWSPELCQLMSWLQDTPPMTPEQLSTLTISMSDFHEALRHVQPSAKREGFATVPDVTWDDVGSLANVRAELQLCVLAPVRYAKQFSQLGLNAPAGVLLCGPPGCGKTLLAKAVANEAGINFISVKGPELLNMYVGESERAVRQVFQRARNSAPCVIFFDELDALCPRRSDSGDNGVSSRVVNQLLTEMDGIEGRSSVFLMAASNRPDIIDPAVLRPGRLDKLVYVGLPNSEDRKDILRALTKNGTRPQLAPDVDLAELASRPQLDGYSGADLAALVREAGVQALRDFIIAGGDSQMGPLHLSLINFNSAAAKIRPSVSPRARKHYEQMQDRYCSTTSPEGEKSEAMDSV